MVKIGDKIILISIDDPAFTGVRKNVDGEGTNELLEPHQIWLWKGIRGTVLDVKEDKNTINTIEVIWDDLEHHKLALYQNKDQFSIVPVSDTNQTIVTQTLGEIVHSIRTLQKYTYWKSISKNPEIYSDLLKQYKKLRGIDYSPIN